jgi:hypothetical protein
MKTKLTNKIAPAVNKFSVQEQENILTSPYFMLYMELLNDLKIIPLKELNSS